VLKQPVEHAPDERAVCAAALQREADRLAATLSPLEHSRTASQRDANKPLTMRSGGASARRRHRPSVSDRPCLAIGKTSGIVPVDPGNGAERNTLLRELSGLLGRGVAVDATRVGLAVMDLARLFGELVPDIVAGGFDMPAKLAQLVDQRGLARRRPLGLVA